MDSHDVGRARGGLAAALKRIQARTLVIGIDSDIQFPAAGQKPQAELIPEANFRIIHSLYGHDGFLLEFSQIEQLVKGFLEEGARILPEGNFLFNH